ncbi:MAG: class III signal peptide-containing protein [Myxococcota bacterium]|nr:class III signal peptide-containing protein [Myxococcota bacterium]
MNRRGQGSVEVMLLISVIVVAIVAVAWPMVGGEEGIAKQLGYFGERAETVYYCEDCTR